MLLGLLTGEITIAVHDTRWVLKPVVSNKSTASTSRIVQTLEICKNFRVQFSTRGEGKGDREGVGRPGEGEGGETKEDDEEGDGGWTGSVVHCSSGEYVPQSPMMTGYTGAGGFPGSWVCLG